MLVVPLLASGGACGRIAFDPRADAGSALGSDSGDATVELFDLCPTTPALVDDFEDATIDVGPNGTWAGVFGSTLGLEETQGQLVISFPSSTPAATGAGVFSDRIDVTTGCAIASLPVVPDPATGAYAYIELQEPTGSNRSKATILIGAGNLVMRRDVAGTPETLVTITYDAIEHRMLRLRTGANQIAWETSRDGISWFQHAEQTSFLDLSMALFLLGAGTDVVATNAGTAHFDTARVFVP